MVASRRVTRSSAANTGGGLKMTVTAPIGACHDDLDVSLNDVVSLNTADLRHRIPRRRTTNVGGSQAPTQQAPTQGAGILTQPSPNGFVCGEAVMLPGDFNSPLFQFGETSGIRTPGLDPSDFWAMMRAKMFNQPMTGFHMPVTIPQPTFQPEGRREIQQNVVESAELFAQHLKNVMTDSRMNLSAGGPENKDLSRSQQRDNGNAPERRANKKQTSRRDKDTASKLHEPLKEKQGESESHVSLFSRMRVPATERLHGRRNAFLQGGAGKMRMPCEEQCDRQREVHLERPSSQIEQSNHHPILRAPQGAPNTMDGGVGKSFPATLDGLASEWFNELPEGKIDSWEDLARRFLVHFARNRKKKLHFSHLLSVRQRPDELLREFLARWKLDTTRAIEGIPGEMEAGRQNQVIHFPSSSTVRGRDPRDTRSLGKDAYEEGAEDRKPYSPSGPKLLFLDELTPLTHPVRAILDFAEHQGLVEYDPRFPPICTVGEGPYCRFHRAAGHDTNACKVLKREIENLIQAGYLRQFVKKKNTCSQLIREWECVEEARSSPGSATNSIATALLKEEEGHPRAEPAEKTEDVVIMEEQQEKKIKLSINMSAELRSKIIQVLKENFVVFAWNVEDMLGVSKSLITHRLAPVSDRNEAEDSDFMVECTARDNNPTPIAEQGEWWTLSSGKGLRWGRGNPITSRIPLIPRDKIPIQVKGEFDTKEERMRLYKEAALELLKTLKEYELVQIPSAENTEADVLSKLSNDSPEHISKMAHVEDLGSPSIHVQLISVITEGTSGWIAELIRYKKDGILPNGETAARLIKRRAPTYVIENGRLYKRSYNGTLLRCVDEARAGQIMEEVHEGICAAHQDTTRSMYAIRRPPAEKEGNDGRLLVGKTRE
ncbi:unnamed protein product [Cuscuta campestris]|uniref:Retrotransposon gag domain-containing protein n=1 Tax=Cuscuta campestris TaxID=132261 RepID=A0A484MTZ7_9ASTE|nr:unnamed protein product [Cuscuta campestris]